MRPANNSSRSVTHPQAEPSRRKLITSFGSDAWQGGKERPPQASHLVSKQKFAVRKQKFNRLRREAKIDFDEFYRLFANGFAFSEIARRAGLSRPRVDLIFADYFSDLFGMTGLQRLRA